MIEINQCGNVTVLTVKEPELNDSEKLVSVIQNTVEQNHIYILLDLSFVTYISSIVLGSLVSTYKNIKNKQGEIKFLNVQPSVANIFKMTRLHNIFEFFNDRDTAIKSFPSI